MFMDPAPSPSPGLRWPSSRQRRAQAGAGSAAQQPAAHAVCCAYEKRHFCGSKPAYLQLCRSKPAYLQLCGSFCYRHFRSQLLLTHALSATYQPGCSSSYEECHVTFKHCWYYTIVPVYITVGRPSSSTVPVPYRYYTSTVPVLHQYRTGTTVLYQCTLP